MYLYLLLHLKSEKSQKNCIALLKHIEYIIQRYLGGFCVCGRLTGLYAYFCHVLFREDMF